MYRALKYRRREGTICIQRKRVVPYNDRTAWSNIAFVDILQTIEDSNLFSLSNNFLKFPNMYKEAHGVEPFDNDWYVYVQYGTANRVTIVLQRFGFTRETDIYLYSAQRAQHAHLGRRRDVSCDVPLQKQHNPWLLGDSSDIASHQIRRTML